MSTPPRLRHWCEVCGLEQVMTAAEAFAAGWDAPPNMGAFGVVSPRTCGSCTIEKTVWFRLVIDRVEPAALSEADYAVLARIAAETESMLVAGEGDE